MKYIHFLSQIMYLLLAIEQYICEDLGDFTGTDKNHKNIYL